MTPPADTRELATLAEALRRGHLSAPALRRWAGTDRLSALAPLVPGLRAREVVPASALLALFVAGAALAPELLPAALLPRLLQADLVERTTDGRVRARLALLPLGAALVACDRLDAPAHRELACWPDDSSYHLALALPPERCERWLDLGCGSAVAQLWHPQRASALAGADRNPRVLARARLGAALAGLDLALYEGDLGDGVPPAWRGACDLVSCNAPIPDDDHAQRPLWQASEPGVIARVIEHAHALLAPGGLAVVHAALPALLTALAAQPGERVVVAYTPAEGAQFGVAWWRPGAAPLSVAVRRELTRARPHVGHADRLAALRGELAPLL